MSAPTVILDIDVSPQPTSGFAYLYPTAQVTDPTDGITITTAPAAYAFNGSQQSPVIYATDNSNMSPSGWAWFLDFSKNPFVPGNPTPITFFAPVGPLNFTATNASPCVFTPTYNAAFTTAFPNGLPNGVAMTLAGGSLPTGFTAATTYYIVGATSTTFQLSATRGGSPINSSGSGSGTLTITRYTYSGLVSQANTASYSPYALNSSTTNIQDKGGQVHNVKAYGASGNCKVVLDGAISSSSNTTTLTSATANFSNSDVGKLVAINGAGAAGAVLSTTIASVTNSTTAIVGAAASTTVSGAKVTWGTDDTAYIQAAMNAAGPKGATVFFPSGNYLLTNHLLWDTSASSIATLAPSLQGSLGQGGPSIDAIPSPAVPIGGVALMAHPGTFPLGEFIFDYIGCNPAGGAAGNIGFVIQGFTLYCNARAAGLRSFNSEDSDHSYIVINNAAAPNPANTAGGPLGAVNFVANPSFQAWNNTAERVYVIESAQHSFYFTEGSGSFVIGRECNSVNAGWAGFYCLKNTMLIGCLSQGSGKNNPQTAFYNSEFEIGGATLVGCLSVATGAKGPGLILLAGAANINNIITGCTFLGTNSTGLTEKFASIVYVINGGATQHHTTISGSNLHTGSHTSDYVYVDSGTTGSIVFANCHFTTAGGALATQAYNLNSTNVVQFKNCEGINPAGSQTVAVPATTVATSPLPFDAWFYVTEGSTLTCSVVVSGVTAGPSITVAGTASNSVTIPVFVPAGQTITPTYAAANAPTWVVYGV